MHAARVQPTNVLPLAGVSVNVTLDASVNDPVHVTREPVQLTPLGLLVTVTVPVPV